MCGIIACRTHRPAADYLLTALRRLEYRGYDSVGVAVRTCSGDIARLRTVGRIAALEHQLHTWTGSELDGTGIGHTRWATHGAVTEGNAHPHNDCSGRISLVHNGTIENADRLREVLTGAGHRLASTVDSEVLAHLVEDELLITDDLRTAVRNALAVAEGSWALAVLERGTGRIVVAASGSPLLVARTAHGVFAASDIAAIADWVDEFQVLDDGDVIELTAADPAAADAGRTPPTMVRCIWRSSDADLNGYADHMAKEIDEQPAAAARVLDELADGVAAATLWNDLGLAPFDRLQIIACGTSLNAGMVIGNAVHRLSGLPVTRCVASEAGMDTPEPRTLCLAISQSGETADVLHAIDTRVAEGCSILAVTNSPHSTVGRRADGVVHCAAGPEIGVAATKTFTCQIIAGVAVTLSALVAMNRLSRSAAAALVDQLRRLPDELARTETVAKSVVPPLAEQCISATGYVFIARGSGLPYAAEGALKLKELTYRWAEHYPAGELKHGPLALISDGTPVIVIDNGDPKLATNIAEVQARGGSIIRIGPSGSSVPVIENPVAPWGPLQSAIPLQIFARTSALMLGRDVDKPRNLAKSVTVE
ncbi:glutamine--fructose-6-phosphate aminotransferase [Mycobacterium sp. IS-1742]|uniref:glutamine--fructose-6-phosphate transaminase (isomerizing) n=1 Tax=Mycobacterium sp. IS-1742 TaxID=1772285 RepID=UPI00073FD473|nr:glutamine--fructose-6-phosphate transaminase (isomerizing) [Mycobacterium sp. IS-1742]KUI29135.1 glutamine--fructose-6-phosphate aminotransferase [Mycobacterium sp. IS-1742]